MQRKTCPRCGTRVSFEYESTICPKCGLPIYANDALNNNKDALDFHYCIKCAAEGKNDSAFPNAAQHSRQTTGTSFTGKQSFPHPSHSVKKKESSKKRHSLKILITTGVILAISQALMTAFPAIQSAFIASHTRPEPAAPPSIGSDSFISREQLDDIFESIGDFSETIEPLEQLIENNIEADNTQSFAEDGEGEMKLADPVLKEAAFIFYSDTDSMFEMLNFKLKILSNHSDKLIREDTQEYIAPDGEYIEDLNIVLDNYYHSPHFIERMQMFKEHCEQLDDLFNNYAQNPEASLETLESLERYTDYYWTAIDILSAPAGDYNEYYSQSTECMQNFVSVYSEYLQMQE